MNEDYWPTEEWRAEDPESVGLHADILSDLESVIPTRFQDINAFLVTEAIKCVSP